MRFGRRDKDPVTVRISDPVTVRISGPLEAGITNEWIPWIWARHGSEVGGKHFVEVEGLRTGHRRIYEGQTLTLTLEVKDPRDELRTYKPKP